LRSKIRVQEEQLSHLANLVHEMTIERVQLEEEVDQLSAWLKVAQTARDSAERTRIALEGLNASLSAEIQLERQVDEQHPEVVKRVLAYGKAGGHWMTDEVMEIGKSIQIAAQNRVNGVLDQLESAKSLLHFASLDLEALTLSRDATSNALTAKKSSIYHINALPNELLRKIFLEVVDAEVSTRNQTALSYKGQTGILRAVVSPLRVGAVSSRWRELTYSCVELWRAVSFNLADPNSFGLSQRTPDQQLQRIQHYLRHSKNSELNVVVCIRGNADLEGRLELLTATLSKRSISQLIFNATHPEVLRRTPFGGAVTQTTGDLPDLGHLLARLPSARVLKLAPLGGTNDHNTADFLFTLELASLASCISLTCSGIRPSAPSPGAQAVQHLSITRTSKHASWNLNAILASFPNLAHLEMDPTLVGCVEGLDDHQEVSACTLSKLKRVTTSLTGLDDLNKSVQRRLSLPSFNHLTLADVLAQEKAPPFVWIAFSSGEYAAKITTLEVMECSVPLFIDLRSLSALYTLKLHSTAVQAGLKSFAVKPSVSAEDPLPASLKEMHLFDSDISGETILETIKQMRSNSDSHAWTYPSLLHVSGCWNITKDFRSKLEDQGDCCVHSYYCSCAKHLSRCGDILRTLL
jgi:hypothetical protein